MNTTARPRDWLLVLICIVVLTGCHRLVASTPEVALSPVPEAGSIHGAPIVIETNAPPVVVYDSDAFTVTAPISDTATAAFMWSYVQLLNNWNPATGLVRDKDAVPSGAFDAIQATGSLAAVTALADQLGVIAHGDARWIVDRIGRALLHETPRYRGLWPHFVQVSPEGAITIVPGTEWSSVDTVIAAIGLLTAQHGLGLDTAAAEEMLRAIDWADLTAGPGGMIAHGYAFAGDRLPGAWDTFGTESWLVELAYAAATGRVAPLAHPAPPTANGSGFIDELAWLFVRPPSAPDTWGVAWPAYRSTAANKQIGYYPRKDAASCVAQAGLFGLSAAEVPDPSQVAPENVYQAFGVGGRFALANDGSALSGAPVVVPHYSALIAALRPADAIAMWDWLIRHGFFSPKDNVESLMFPPGASCDPGRAAWNRQHGSWNLALQALGWGRYLAQRRGQTPILWRAAIENPLLREGYRLLAPNEAPEPSPGMWTISRECEDRAEPTVGQTLERPHASGLLVHGQFGTISTAPWSPQGGAVRYAGIVLPEAKRLYLRLRYSKFSPASVPVAIYLDDEASPRAVRYLVDQGSWDNFAWTEPILLGAVVSGTHILTFATAGQTYGVADLDLFILANEPPAIPPLTLSPIP